MADGQPIPETIEHMPAASLTLKPRHGYCADCGTWDAHGRFCAACGYDFMPDSETEALT